MNNKILYEINTVLEIFRNKPEFAAALLGIREEDIFINVAELIPGYFDYFYKTMWLFDCCPNGEVYTFGVVENGNVILLKYDESMPDVYCYGIQNVPMCLLYSNFNYEPQERCELIERSTQSTPRNKKYTDYLKEFAQYCRQSNVELNEIYNYNLEKDIIPKEIIENVFSEKEYEYLSIGEITGKGPGCYPQWNKGEMYYPCVTRPFLKPVTKLYTPRLLTGEFHYPDVKLVEHKMDGENFDLDEKYIQE